MTIALPTQKKMILVDQICKFEKTEMCTIRKFAQFISSLVASCPGVEYGLVHSKSLERAKLEALGQNDGDFDKLMKIPDYVREDLHWWKVHLQTSYKKIKTMNFKREIFSDASKTGWGAYCDGRKAYGHWNPDQVELL